MPAVASWFANGFMIRALLKLDELGKGYIRSKIRKAFILLPIRAEVFWPWDGAACFRCLAESKFIQHLLFWFSVVGFSGWDASTTCSPHFSQFKFLDNPSFWRVREQLKLCTENELAACSTETHLWHIKLSTDTNSHFVTHKHILAQWILCSGAK